MEWRPIEQQKGKTRRRYAPIVTKPEISAGRHSLIFFTPIVIQRSELDRVDLL